MEHTPLFTAYLEVLTRLIAYGKSHLGGKRVATLVEIALAPTPFAHFQLTEDGFNLTSPNDQQILAFHHNHDQKMAAYKLTTTRLYIQLANILGIDDVEAFMKKTITHVEQHYQVKLDITLDLPYMTSDSLVDKVKSWLGNPVEHPLEQQSIAMIDDILTTNKLYQVLFENLPEGILILNHEQQILFANPAAERLLGADHLELEHQAASQVIHLAGENGPIRIDEFLPKTSVHQGPIIFQGHDLILNNATEQNTSVEVTTSKLNHPTLATVFYLMRIVPIEQAVMAGTNQIDLMSVTAHELKSPLTSLRGYLAILQDELHEKIGPDQLLFLDRMATSTNQLLTMLENLLAFNKIENKTLSLLLEPTDLSALIEKVVSDVQPMARSKQVTITFEKPSVAIPQITLDMLRITEVITNLLSNAIKFNKAGGGVWIRLYNEANHIRVEVADNGAGIAENEIPKLFNKYVQLKKPQDGNVSGSGLGLYISKRIIVAHEGSIWVHSKEGYGSTFIFTLPLDHKADIVQAQTKTKPDREKRFFTTQGNQLVH